MGWKSFSDGDNVLNLAEEFAFLSANVMPFQEKWLATIKGRRHKKSFMADSLAEGQLWVEQQILDTALSELSIRTVKPISGDKLKELVQKVEATSRLTDDESDWAAIVRKDLAEHKPVFSIGDVVEFQHFLLDKSCRGIVLGVRYAIDAEAPTTEKGWYRRGWQYTVQPLAYDPSVKEPKIGIDDLEEQFYWEGQLAIVQKNQGV